MRHIFIINPAAGHRQHTAAVIGQIERACKARGVEYDVYLTAHAGHAVDIVRTAAKAHPDKALVFYACGGDGTLNEVATGVAELERQDCAFTAYPIGTGNDYVKMFKGGKAAFLQLEDLLDGTVVDVD